VVLEPSSFSRSAHFVSVCVTRICVRVRVCTHMTVKYVLEDIAIWHEEMNFKSSGSSRITTSAPINPQGRIYKYRISHLRRRLGQSLPENGVS
jgi:hypothetical protein